MPKTLLNVSQSTGAKPSVSLNTSQVMSAKHSTGFHKPKTSMNLPQTTKNLVVKPPIGNTSSLIQKKKSTLAQPSEYSNTLSGGKAGGGDGPVSRSHRSGAAHFNSGTTNHTRNKSAERTTSTGLNSAKNKGLTALKVGKSSVSVKIQKPLQTQSHYIFTLLIFTRLATQRPIEARVILQRRIRLRRAIRPEALRTCRVTYWTTQIQSQ